MNTKFNSHKIALPDRGKKEAASERLRTFREAKTQRPIPAISSNRSNHESHDLHYIENVSFFPLIQLNDAVDLV